MARMEAVSTACLMNVESRNLCRSTIVYDV
jgi:hypothetical protein